MPFDDRVVQWLQSLKFLGVDSPFAAAQFFNHFFLHATLTFLFLSVPWRHRRPLALLSLALALCLELIRDGHYQDLFSGGPSAMDGRTDLIARGLGSLLPFATLLFSRIKSKFKIYLPDFPSRRSRKIAPDLQTSV